MLCLHTLWSVFVVVFRVDIAYSKWKSWRENKEHSSEDKDPQQLRKRCVWQQYNLPVQSCQRCKKHPGEISGYGQVLNSSAMLNAKFGWAVLQLLVKYSCNSSSPSFGEGPLCQSTGGTFISNCSLRSMVTSPIITITSRNFEARVDLQCGLCR